jgi:hypothetical protein
MNTTSDPDCRLAGANAKCKKAPYQAPVLQVYGAVKWSTAGSGGNVRDMGSRRSSDRTAKENIVRVGTHPLGIGLYLFDYKPEYRKAPGFGRGLRAMADEVKVVLPQTVIVHPHACKMSITRCWGSTSRSTAYIVFSLGVSP